MCRCCPDSPDGQTAGTIDPQTGECATFAPPPVCEPAFGPDTIPFSPVSDGQDEICFFATSIRGQDIDSNNVVTSATCEELDDLSDFIISNECVCLICEFISAGAFVGCTTQNGTPSCHQVQVIRGRGCGEECSV